MKLMINRLSSLIIAINFLFVFACTAQSSIDPYWQFNEEKHFKPKLSKSEFYTLSGYDFCWYVLEPLTQFIESYDFEIERGKSLSYGQKALYYWWYLDGQVTNGGFAQFYSNGYGHYVPAIINGLEHVGDTAMAKLVKQAEKIYQKNKKYIDGNAENDAFGFDSDDKIDEISFFNEQYFDMNHQTMALIETYFRRNPNEICLDENGNKIDMGFSGPIASFYEDKNIKNEYNLELGVINGAFKSYYQNGKPKALVQFIQGKLTGEREEFYENGIIKYKVEKDSSQELLIHTWFYENGNPQKLESKLAEKNKRRGAYKEWFENGQLWRSGFYKSEFDRSGKWEEYYQNGQKRLEGEHIGMEYKLINFWNENGEQTLKNGTGHCVFEGQMFSDLFMRYESAYKDFKRHGVQKSFSNGILTHYQEMNNGMPHGITRSFYKNGNLEREIIYDNGRAISNKMFRKFQNPKVKTTIVSRLCIECHDKKGIYEMPDNIPKPINAATLASDFKPELSSFTFRGDDDTVTCYYIVYVDKGGKPIKLKMTSCENFLNPGQVETNLNNIEFEIALKDGEAIESIHFVQHQFILIE
jgi:antitoxin component YwqK of YwqJK toxin-antitoxin module